MHAVCFQTGSKSKKNNSMKAKQLLQARAEKRFFRLSETPGGFFKYGIHGLAMQAMRAERTQQKQE
jgi:hypothetical protein